MLLATRRGGLKSGPGGAVSCEVQATRNPFSASASAFKRSNGVETDLEMQIMLNIENSDEKSTGTEP